MKKGTKILALAIFGLLAVSIFAGIISAQTAAEAGTTIKENLLKPLGDFVAALFGTSTSTFTIQKIFLAILLTLVIYSIVKDLFGQRETVAWGISIIVSILGIMFLSNELIDAIAIQYGAMGAAILTVIPLIIMLVFTISIKSLLIARISWIFYVIYYFLLYISGIATDKFSTTASWYYLAAIVIGAVMFFSAKFFRKLLSEGKLEEKEEKAITGIRLRQKTREVLEEEAESLGFKLTPK